MEKQIGLVRYFSRYDRIRTLAMVALLGVAGLMEGVGFAAFLPLLDKIVAASPAGGGSELSQAFSSALAWAGLEPTLGVFLVVLVVLFALKAALSIAAMSQAGVVVAKVAMELRLSLLRAIISSEWRHVLRYPSGFVANAISRDAQMAAGAYREACIALSDGVQVLAYVAVAVLISWQTALFSMVVGLLIMAALQGRVRAIGRAGSDQTRILRSVVARLTDALPSVKPLKAMGRERYLLPMLEHETQEFFSAQQRAVVAGEMLSRGREPLIVAALATGLWIVLRFTPLTSTSLMVMAVAFYRAVTSFTVMQQRWGSVVAGAPAFDSIMEHIAAAENARETWPDHRAGKEPEFKHEIHIENLSFAYGAHQVLNGVDAVLPAGSFVTLVGPSGSGKTTLTDLITGLLRPTGGRITVDGVDLAELDMRAWRQTIGYVPQDPMLFSDTVRRNVQLGNDEISEEQIERALKGAGAFEFVHRLPNGLDERIGEDGTSLSGGQKQRLAIARALVSDPQLLILDEPTSALDMRTEAEVFETISQLRGSLTILSISHRPVSEELSDEVWELDAGRLQVRATPPR